MSSFVTRKSDDAVTALDAVALPGAAAWAARGFALLAAVLTFLGAKEGVLDRILRAEPTASMWVFALVGLAVVCAVLAPAASPGARVPSWPVSAAVGVLAVLTWLILPKIREPDLSGYADAAAALAAAALVVAGWALRRMKVPVTAAILVVAVAALSLGLYGAAKISVRSKLGPQDPQVGLTVEQPPAGPGTVKVATRAGSRDDEPLLIAVRGQAGPDAKAPEPLGQAQLAADAAGMISAESTFLVDLDRFSEIAVGYCDKDSLCGRDGRWDGWTQTASVAGRRPSVPSQVGASGQADAPGRFTVVVSASRVQPGSFVRARVTRTGSGRAGTVAVLVLVPGPDGAAAGTASMSARPGDVVAVTYRRCASSPAACDADAAEAMTVSVPPS